MKTVLAGGRPLLLLPERAALLPASRTLLVADLHIGKSTSFRALGVPVPHGSDDESLALLARLIDRHAPRHLVFLGDFLHAARSRTPAVLGALARWRARHRALPMTLVRGNHDARAGDPPPFMAMTVVDEPLAVEGLALCHHPLPRAGAYVLAGHVHPGVRLARGLDRLRLPCFHFAADVGLLPAFGAFTGLQEIAPGGDERVYAIADDRVLAVPVRGAQDRMSRGAPDLPLRRAA